MFEWESKLTILMESTSVRISDQNRSSISVPSVGCIGSFFSLLEVWVIFPIDLEYIPRKKNMTNQEILMTNNTRERERTVQRHKKYIEQNVGVTFSWFQEETIYTKKRMRSDHCTHEWTIQEHSSKDQLYIVVEYLVGSKETNISHTKKSPWKLTAIVTIFDDKFWGNWIIWPSKNEYIRISSWRHSRTYWVIEWYFPFLLQKVRWRCIELH